VDGKKWYIHGTDQGGNPIDFLTRIEGKAFNAAVEALTGIRPAPPASRPVTTRATAELKLPDKAPDNRRVIAYLTKTRGLPANLVVQMIRERRLYQDQRGNCVFVCGDPPDQVKGTILRGTGSQSFKGRTPGSDVAYGWHLPPVGGRQDNLLTIVESPIDGLSLLTLSPDLRSGHLLAVGGLHRRALDGFLNRHPEITHVILALDADAPGIEIAAEWCTHLEEAGKKVLVQPPEQGKDWNEQLQSKDKTPAAPVVDHTCLRYYEPEPAMVADLDR
jgi:hypothetical protein